MLGWLFSNKTFYFLSKSFCDGGKAFKTVTLMTWLSSEIMAQSASVAKWSKKGSVDSHFNSCLGVTSSDAHSMGFALIVTLSFCCMGRHSE